ncbi:MAG: polysaccharide pyruvyl transferase family protein [Planctomycetota bacterium]
MLVTVLNHTGTSHHLGCLGAMYALEGELRRRYGPAVGIRRVPSTIDPGWSSECASGDDFEKLVQEVGNRPVLAEHLDDTDLLVLNGEGTLHWPAANRRVWLWLAMVEHFKRQCGRAVWVVNSSFFSADKLFLDCAARVFGRVEHLAIRDPLSLATLRARHLDHAVQAADLVFLTSVRMTGDVADMIASEHEPSLDAGGAPTLLLAGSSALTEENRPDWRETFSRLIEDLTARHATLQVVFVAQSAMANDLRLAEELAGRHANLRLLSADLAPVESAWLVGRADLVVSGRFHVNAFAIACGTPAILLPGNTAKNEGLASLADSQRYRSLALEEVEGALAFGRAALRVPGEKERSPAKRLFRLAWNNFPADVAASDTQEPVDPSEYLRQVRFAGLMCEWEQGVRLRQLERRVGRLRELLENERAALAEFEHIRTSRMCRAIRKMVRLLPCALRPTGRRNGMSRGRRSDTRIERHD